VPAARALGGTVAVAGYEVLGELGRGGMGVVYRARQVALDRTVALKMILSGVHAGSREMARFQAEAGTVARLHHPNIVQIFEVGEYDGRPFLALELVAGGTLQARLAGTPQPARPAAHLVEVLARAVHHAHEKGVVHRDLKPGNVLLAPRTPGGPDQDPADAPGEALYGVPKIADFGLAKRLDEAGATRSGDLLGTPSYMSPEQAAGRTADVGPATDVYALGAILYELLTGRPPFRAETVTDTLRQVIDEEPVPPSRLRRKLPRDLERVCLKCLEKEPARRYASAQELADDLRRHLDGETVRARPASPPERLWRWSRRNPVASSLLLAITLGSAFGLWHLYSLSQLLVQSSARDAAELQAEALDELNKYYATVADHLRQGKVPLSHNWRNDPTGAPVPATLTIELGEQISARSNTGQHVRLYSDYPFRGRTGGGPRDDFERAALDRLRQVPDQSFYRFEEFQGRPSLRFATARRMEAGGCVNCHNSHPDSPKRDWQPGDVRGVLEIIRPLDRDEARTREGLRGTFCLVVGTGLALLTLSGLGALVAARRRRRRASRAFAAADLPCSQ
jgi:serine/threonine protein kinase